MSSHPRARQLIKIRKGLSVQQSRIGRRRRSIFPHEYPHLRKTKISSQTIMLKWNFLCYVPFLSLCTLILVGASPNGENEDHMKIVRAIASLATETTKAILSQQKSLQDLLTAVQSQTDCRCQTSEAIIDSLTDVKSKVNLFEEKLNSAADQTQREEILKSIARVQKEQESIGRRLSDLELRHRQSHCQSPFELVGRDCIYVYTEKKMKWQKAREYCTGIGADLVVPSNVIHLAKYLKHEYGDDFWVGASDLETEGDFRWIDGTKVDESWRSGEPNDYRGGEDCVLFVYGSGNLIDIKCSYDSYFVCSMA
ncbi:uncharacterized protein LOC143025462 [Oratosquilla oratoria]|uniref:uncharacterized protein LOC143025462 n=1 Tax=Oratosquilla oratoria TaxID=337810 RepID=UPI003F7739B4